MARDQSRDDYTRVDVAGDGGIARVLSSLLAAQAPYAEATTTDGTALMQLQVSVAMKMRPALPTPTRVRCREKECRRGVRASTVNAFL